VRRQEGHDLLLAQGHNAIPSLQSGAFKTPHLEAYTTGGAVEAFADAAGNQAFAKSCKQAPDLASRFSGQTHKSITTTQAVNCSLPAKADLKAAKAAGGSLFLVTVGHTGQLAVSAALKPTGSTLAYDTRFCKVAPAQATPTKYEFSGLTASFSLHGAAISYTLSGTVCGDPTTTPWSLAVTLNGSASTQSVVLPNGTAANPTSIVFKDQSGNPVASATLQLTFATGPPATMTLGVAPTGDVTNVQVGGSPAPVTATPVASC
jgi:hypothetical protein